MEEFAELKKRYWGQHLWGIGYRAWSSGNITDEMIADYLDHHRENPIVIRISFWNSFSALAVYRFSMLFTAPSNDFQSTAV